jgi:prepilin-type N-terminal cleavage/methylation domain-containing protein
MNQHRRFGFTLIELLVVIAIIAILAAILFPVFAQAKAAAKATTSLMNCKEMALGQIMYQNDADDAFSPVSTFDAAWEIRPFSFLQQPYMKSWGVVMDPLSPATANSTVDVIRSQWAMPPLRAATVSESADDYTLGRSDSGKKFTGGQLYYYEGLAGVGKDPATWTWGAYSYRVGATPSLSQTAVSSPSDMVMIVQSGTYDMMWQFANWGDGPDSFDRYWGDGVFNLYGDNDMVCGPMARVHGSGVTAGVVPIGSGATQPLPTANTIYAAVDGHAKNVAWSQLMGKTKDVGNGKLVIQAFWPN